MEPEVSQFQPSQRISIQQESSSFKKYKWRIIVWSSMGLFVVTLLLVTILMPQHIATQNHIASQSRLSDTTTTISPPMLVDTTQTQLSANAGSPLNTNSLPLGDSKYTTTEPKKGYIYLCHVQSGQGGTQVEGNWIHGTTWNLLQKPHVTGSVSWSKALFSTTSTASTRTIIGNDLPVNATTGIYPIQVSDPAYKYDRNPNSITAHSFTLSLPINPTYSSVPSCMGGEVGIMLNGIPLFNGFDAEHRDAAAHEVQDACGGHPQVSGEYHYHNLSSCIKDIHETTIIGYALDGYAITGPVLENGNYLTTNDLDECHGVTSAIFLNGKKISTYHYVLTNDFPYSVSCFRAKPAQMQVIGNQGGQVSPITNAGQGSAQQSTSHPSPPKEAFTACNGKTLETSCSFTSPGGNVSGTCQLPTPSNNKCMCSK